MAKIVLRPGESLDHAVERFQKADKAEKVLDYAKRVKRGYSKRRSGFKRQKNTMFIKKDDPLGAYKKTRCKPKPPPPGYDFDY